MCVCFLNIGLIGFTNTTLKQTMHGQNVVNGAIVLDDVPVFGTRIK